MITPDYIKIAEIVANRGRVLTSELGKSLVPVPIEQGGALDQAERVGLIRQDGHKGYLYGFVFDYYWVPGRNNASLAARSIQIADLRKQVNAAAREILRSNAQVLRETFDNASFSQELLDWMYNDDLVAHDEWQLDRDAEALRQPLPEPPKPVRTKVTVPPKPKKWERKD